MARVVIEHLSKHFEGPRGERIGAVEDLSLTVEDKELLVLVGPSGCGKTTALRMIAGLEVPDGGTISIDGEIVNRLEPKERDVAMVFQNYALYPHMSVYENMAFGLKLRKVPRSEIKRRVREAAERLDLGRCLERKPRELSGGQQQRVAVGRAMVRRPRLFLFDEPLSNLDPQMRVQMRREIVRLHRGLAEPAIYVTHDQAEAMTLGDRIAVMREGRIHQADEPLKVYAEPADLFVAGFIGSPPMNLFRGRLARKEATVLFEADAAEAGAGSGGFALRLNEATAVQMGGYIGKPIVLGIRPEQVALCFQPEAAPAGRVVRAAIEGIEPMGSETQVHLASGGQRFVARVRPGERVKADQEVWAVFERERERFFDAATGKAVGR